MLFRDYPGSAIFPWCRYLVCKTFINGLSVLNILILIAAVPYFFKIVISPDFYRLLILALPITQISLKGFSLRSMLFAVLAVYHLCYLILKSQ